MKNQSLYFVLIACLLAIIIFLIVSKPTNTISELEEKIILQNSIIKEQNQRIVAMNNAGNKMYNMLYNKEICPNYKAGSLE